MSSSGLGQASRVTKLLDIGVDPESHDLGGPLHEAARRGNELVVQLLVADGADIEQMNSGYYTPLHEAAAAGNVSVVRALLELGAAVNAVSKLGETPLHRAAVRGHSEIARLLLIHGAWAGAGRSRF